MALESGPARKLLEQAVELARKVAPGADVRASALSGRRTNTRFARSEITSSGEVEETTLTLHLGLGQRHASTTSNQLDRGSLEAQVRRTKAMAEIVPEDPEWQPALSAQGYVKVHGAHDPATEALPAAARAAAARAAIAAADAAKVEIAGFQDGFGGALAVATSAGLFAYHRWTEMRFSATARTADGTGSGWGNRFANRAADLDPDAVAKVAIDKAVRSAKPRRLEPGRYTVVLEPAAVSELLSFLVMAADARQADEGRSFFAKKGGGTKVGEKLFGDAITLVSDVTSPETPAAPFDWEGLPLRKTTWIEQGTLRSLIWSRYWARKQGREPTGSPSVVQLAGGTATAEELVAGVKKGVLVTRFWYSRWVDPQSVLVTGLTRDGVFLIEDGRVVAPVNNFRFNESPVAMLRNADALTRDTARTPFGNFRVPGLRTHEFNLASVSDAV